MSVSVSVSVAVAVAVGGWVSLSLSDCAGRRQVDARGRWHGCGQKKTVREREKKSIEQKRSMRIMRALHVHVHVYALPVYVFFCTKKNQ